MQERIKADALAYASTFRKMEIFDSRQLGYIAGATEYAIWKEKHDELKKQFTELEQWKESSIRLINPIIEYAQMLSDAKVGDSCSGFVIARCKEYDMLKEKYDNILATEDGHLNKNRKRLAIGLCGRS